MSESTNLITRFIVVFVESISVKLLINFSVFHSNFYLVAIMLRSILAIKLLWPLINSVFL